MIVEATCLAIAVYFEGRSEPLDGQLAIAEVVINRAKHPDFPSTICEVVKEHRAPVSKPRACQFSFYCDGLDEKPREDKAWQTAQEIAAQALSGDTLGHGATFYHTKDVKPRWRHSLTRVGAIGAHIFYSDGKCLIEMGCSKRPRLRSESLTE